MAVFFKPPFLKLEIEESKPDLSADGAGKEALIGGAGGAGGGGGGGGGIPPDTGCWGGGGGGGGGALACGDEGDEPFTFGLASVLFGLRAT